MNMDLREIGQEYAGQIIWLKREQWTALVYVALKSRVA
jgi:hypothetical protein